MTIKNWNSFYGCPLVERFFVEQPSGNDTNDDLNMIAEDDNLEIDDFLEMNMEVEE